MSGSGQIFVVYILQVSTSLKKKKKTLLQVSSAGKVAACATAETQCQLDSVRERPQSQYLF